YNVSLGYTIGTSLALGAEYEYQDYSTMKFRGPTGSSSEFTFRKDRSVVGGYASISYLEMEIWCVNSGYRLRGLIT
ncbi:TonB-dependent receptor, partial [Bacteroides fragilis]